MFSFSSGTQHSPYYSANNMPWVGVLTWVVSVFGHSVDMDALMANPVVWESLKFLMLGSFIETGRRLLQWIVSFFTFKYSVSGEFRAGDPTYEWLVSYLTKKSVWKTPHDFVVESKSTRRKFRAEGTAQEQHVDYIPTYTISQFFRWKGYIMEVTQPQNNMAPPPMYYRDEYDDDASYRKQRSVGLLILKVYTRDQTALYRFVDECRVAYEEQSKRLVTIHSQGRPDFNGMDRWRWGIAQTKNRRPIDSLLLDGSTVETLLSDAREFLEVEDWYINAGIPHRRGYLLYGPPGTGKTSTIYTIAGELGLEIYCLSLSSTGLDDRQLSQAVAALPHRCILVIEDIDCAFPPRRDDNDDDVVDSSRQWSSMHPGWPGRPSQVTFSGLLNVLDGIGSEEGKIFFATTNHIDRLDSALLRPGRIDRKIEYKLASKRQARGLYCRFFPVERFSTDSKTSQDNGIALQYTNDITIYADTFVSHIPDHEFSVAELQGFLLDHKTRPIDAAHSIKVWVEEEMDQRRKKQLQKELREKLRQEKEATAKMEEQANFSKAFMNGLGSAVANGVMPMNQQCTQCTQFQPQYLPSKPSVVTLPPVEWSCSEGSASPE